MQGYPFEATVKSKKFNGVILSDQVKNLDWTIREAELIKSTNKLSLKEVLNNVKLLVF
nr:toxin-antitoxin system, toxin component, MazF family protein [Leptospira alstonii]